VLCYLAIKHLVHMDVLDLEGAPGGLHADQHSAIDREARRAEVGAAVGCSAPRATRPPRQSSGSSAAHRGSWS
jgi:hypothetical protein